MAFRSRNCWRGWFNTILDLRGQFQELKKLRRADPAETLDLIGIFAEHALEILSSHCDIHELTWKGGGEKKYQVFTALRTDFPFSRPVNRELFIPEPSVFRKLWAEFVDVIRDQAGTLQLVEFSREAIDQLFYSAVIGYAAATDVLDIGGGEGTFLEMAVGPTISLLTGRPEEGGISVPLPDGSEFEYIPVDLTFRSTENVPTLVVPTKISTRERISQAFVHQRILDVLSPGGYRSVLVIGNETNVMAAKGAPKIGRSPANGWAQDTLVPRTIALYQSYIAELSGLYYLDPPHQYLAGTYRGLPPVKRFNALLTGDLLELLSVPA